MLGITRQSDIRGSDTQIKLFNKSLLKLSGHEFRLALPKTNGLISGFRKSHVKLREQKHLSQLTCRFPGSTTKGCFFHFNRAILQKAQYTGLLIPSETTLVRHAANLFHAPLDIVYDIWLTPWKTEMKPTFPQWQNHLLIMWQNS